jgi:hypothetical protein
MLATQWAFRGFKDAHHPEAWNPNLTLIEEASAMQEADLSLFPPLVRPDGRARPGHCTQGAHPLLPLLAEPAARKQRLRVTMLP